jgi:hypothetical protein
MAETARKREVDEARKRTRGSRPHDVCRRDVRDRVKAHRKLAAKQRDEYDAMNKRHQKEMEAPRRPAGCRRAMPDA